MMMRNVKLKNKPEDMDIRMLLFQRPHNVVFRGLRRLNSPKSLLYLPLFAELMGSLLRVLVKIEFGNGEMRRNFLELLRL
jgi:hypothetical protein